VLHSLRLKTSPVSHRKNNATPPITAEYRKKISHSQIAQSIGLFAP
jgi:hypothetical protein